MRRGKGLLRETEGERWGGHVRRGEGEEGHAPKREKQRPHTHERKREEQSGRKVRLQQPPPKKRGRKKGRDGSIVL